MAEMKIINVRALDAALRLVGGEVLVPRVRRLTEALDQAERDGYNDGWRDGADAEEMVKDLGGSAAAIASEITANPDQYDLFDNLPDSLGG